jgi:hypothetical protein
MRIFYLLSTILLITVQAKSQNRAMPLSEPETKIVKFYPNPAITSITFDFETLEDKSYSFQIFNFLGKKVYQGTTVTSKTIVNVSDFSRGIYIFWLRDENGRILQSGKFQVVK